MLAPLGVRPFSGLVGLLLAGADDVIVGGIVLCVAAPNTASASAENLAGPRLRGAQASDVEVNLLLMSW